MWISVEMYDAAIHHPFLEGEAWEYHPAQEGRVVEYVADPTSEVERMNPSPEPQGPPKPDVPAPVKVEKPEKYSDETWAEKKARAVRAAKTGKMQWREAVHYYPHPVLTHAEYRVLMIIADHADSDYPYANAHPGHAYVMRATGRTGALTKPVAALKRKGFLVEYRRGNSIGTGVSAAYRLSLPEWEEEQTTSP